MSDNKQSQMHQEKQEPKGWMDQEKQGSMLSRRKLLAVLGATGVAAAAGALSYSGSAEGSATEAVYGTSTAVGCCPVASVAELRGLPGEADGCQVSLLGYYEDTPGRGGGQLTGTPTVRRRITEGRYSLSRVRRQADGNVRTRRCSRSNGLAGAAMASITTHPGCRRLSMRCRPAGRSHSVPGK